MSIRLRRATPLDPPELSRVAQDAKGAWGYPASWLASWAPALTITQSALETLDIVVAEDEQMCFHLMRRRSRSGRLAAAIRARQSRRQEERAL